METKIEKLLALYEDKAIVTSIRALEENYIVYGNLIVLLQTANIDTPNWLRALYELAYKSQAEANKAYKSN